LFALDKPLTTDVFYGQPLITLFSEFARDFLGTGTTSHGRRQGGRAPWIFIYGTDIVFYT